MFGFFSCLKCVVRMGPREFIRQRFKLPMVKYIHDTVDLYKTRTKTGVNNMREILLRGTMIALITALLVWLSIFMYIAFYYAYVPTISHERQVFLKFVSCDQNPNSSDSPRNNHRCSFLTAHVKLTERQRLLMLGQPYKIHLDLEMPESPANKELGMFMVCADLHGMDGRVLANSCRSTMLHYKSNFLDILYKVVFSPFFIFGKAEEKQNVHIELFSEYEEHDSEPVTDILVEIQSRNVEIYSAKFLINAHFSGLRFLMYNWPIISAAIGITSNLFFIAIVCMMSWYQIINSDEYMNYISQRSSSLGKKALEEFDSSESSVSSIDEEMSLIEGAGQQLKFRRGRTGSRESIEDIHHPSSTC